VGYGHATGKNGTAAAQAVISDAYETKTTGPTQEIAMVGIRHRF